MGTEKLRNPDSGPVRADHDGGVEVDPPDCSLLC